MSKLKHDSEIDMKKVKERKSYKFSKGSCYLSDFIMKCIYKKRKSTKAFIFQFVDAIVTHELLGRQKGQYLF